MVAGALFFNGTSQYVNAADHPELDLGTGDFSIDAWVRSSGNPSGVVTILDKRENVWTVPRGYHLYIYNGQLGLQMADASGTGPTLWDCNLPPLNSACTNYTASGGPDVADDEWHHVTATVDRDDPNGGGKLFVDGALVHSFDPTIRALSLDNVAELRIARESSGAPYWPGEIDEVEVFKRELSRAGTPFRRATAPVPRTRAAYRSAAPSANARPSDGPDACFFRKPVSARKRDGPPGRPHDTRR
jgi:hypothetical protein